METTPEVVRNAVAASGTAVMWTLVGTPFDVVKTRLQTSGAAQYRSVFHCLQKTVRADGILALWRGFVPALLMGWPYSVIMFGTFQQLRPPPIDLGSVTGATRSSAASAQPAVVLTARHVTQCFGAGVASGVAVHVISNPLTLWMVQLQTKSASTAVAAAASARGSPCGTASARLASMFRLGMRGSTTTLGINSLGNGIFFTTNEVLRFEFATRDNFGLGQLSSDALTGGLTGVIFRVPIFPLDVVRSRVMASSIDTAAPTFREAARSVLVEHGYMGFARGLSVVVARSFLINSAGWAVMHSTRRALTRAADTTDEIL